MEGKCQSVSHKGSGDLGDEIEEVKIISMDGDL
jgi:hypothetical protein